MNKMDKLEVDIVIGEMDQSYSLSYVDYRDCLNEHVDVLKNCLENKSSDVLAERINDWFIDQEENSVDVILEDLKCKFLTNGYKEEEVDQFFEENECEIRTEIYNRDDSNPIKDLLQHTSDIPVRIELLSNFDSINSYRLESSSGYSYEDSYFGDMVDALNLNPTKVKQMFQNKGETFFGTYPSKAYRNGQELVTYEDLYEELINSCCGANLLVFMGRMNVTELYEHDFNINQIRIPKGNCCGLFSSMQGGGSLIEMALKQDVEITLSKKKNTYPYYRLELDYRASGSYDYSITETYGVYNNFFGDKIQILS